jgi:nucleoside recognition membrane protein YjiH
MTGRMLFICIIIFVGVFTALVMIDPAQQFENMSHRARVIYVPAGHTDKPGK